MRKLNVRYYDELTGAVVHMWVELRVEKDGVVGKNLAANVKDLAARRAVAAIARRVNDGKEDPDDAKG